MKTIAERIFESLDRFHEAEMARLSQTDPKPDQSSSTETPEPKGEQATRTTKKQALGKEPNS
jgi:hypothetical protein